MAKEVTIIGAGIAGSTASGSLTLYAQVQDANNYDNEGTYVLRPDGGSTTWSLWPEGGQGVDGQRGAFGGKMPNCFAKVSILRPEFDLYTDNSSTSLSMILYLA